MERTSQFRKLLEAEIPRLQRYARVLTRDPVRTDDLVQTSLARALAKRELWRYGIELRPWLFAIMHNENANDLRRAARDGSFIVPGAAPPATAEPNAFATLELRDLNRALAELTAEQREVILLVGVECMTYQEVATVLKLPVGTVRHAFRAAAANSAG